MFFTKTFLTSAGQIFSCVYLHIPVKQLCLCPGFNYLLICWPHSQGTCHSSTIWVLPSASPVSAFTPSSLLRWPGSVCWQDMRRFSNHYASPPPWFKSLSQSAVSFGKYSSICWWWCAVQWDVGSSDINGPPKILYHVWKNWDQPYDKGRLNQCDVLNGLNLKCHYKWPERDIWLLLQQFSPSLTWNPFRHNFVCSGWLLLQTLVCHIWVDPQCQPGTVRAQFCSGVLVLLLVHAVKPSEQTKRGEAPDDDMIRGGQGPAEAHLN